VAVHRARGPGLPQAGGAVRYLCVPFRMRTSAAVLCIAIAVFATVVSAIPLMPPALIVAAAWQLAPLALIAVVSCDDAPCEEQTAALLSLVPSRAPPRSVLTA